MTTAQTRLNSVLPTWYELLTQWSLDGSLVAAATEALVLDGSNAKPNAKGQLQSLVSQWSAGNFKSLPQIVLLSNEDISGAQGAYAASTGKIYLNADWLLNASEEEIQKVLTEELGHSLDDQLNLVDTKGDEGEYFANKLLGSDTALIQISQADQIEITVDGTAITAEANIILPSNVIQSAFLSNGSFYAIVDSVNYLFPVNDVLTNSNQNAQLSWELARSYAQQLGGDLVTINNPIENDAVKNFIVSYASATPTVNNFTNYQDIGAWIGFYFNRTTYQWAWSSGQSVTFNNFASSDQNIGGGDSDWVAMYSVSSFMPQVVGQWNDHQNGMSIGVAEIPVTLNVQIDKSVVTEGDPFAISLNPHVASQYSNYLLDGKTIYWRFAGITQEDLKSGMMSGSGIVANGKVEVKVTLKADGVTEGETLIIDVYSDSAMLNKLGTYSVVVVDSAASVIGTATSDATPIIISGDLTAPTVESYSKTSSGRGKNKTTVGAFTDVTIDKSAPLDALVVNGGESNNNITGNGFVDNASTLINETRSAFTGVLVIDGKGGADTITGGASGTNWLTGGGVTIAGTVDTLTGVALTTDIFDLRRNVAEGWEDAYSVGNAVINGYDLGDYIVLAKDSSHYQVAIQTQTIERLNKRGKVIGADTVNFFEIKDLAGDLIATVNGTSFTSSSSSADLKFVYGQNSQDPFEVVLPSAIPGTII